MKRKNNKKRFAAILLFQFRIMVNNVSGKRRVCENRIINFQAKNGSMALVEAKRRGIEAQYSYRNNEGNKVYFEFIGVKDLLCLSPECEPEEVWYDIVQLVSPMERKNTLIPKESDLNAIKNNE